MYLERHGPNPALIRWRPCEMHSDGGKIQQELQKQMDSLRLVFAFSIFFLVSVSVEENLKPSDSPNKEKPTVERSRKQDTSPNLRDIAPIPPRAGPPREVPLRRLPPKANAAQKDGVQANRPLPSSP